MLSDFLRLATQSILQRKLRSTLAVIGVFIGIMAVVGLMTIGFSMERTIDKEVAGVFGTDAFIIVGGSGLGGGHRANAGGAEAYALDLDTLRSLDGVKAVAAVRERTGFIQGPPRDDGTSLQGFLPVRGISAELVTEFQSFIGELKVQPGGRFFDPSEEDVTVLGASIAERLGVRVGDQILVAGDGANELSMTVVGILVPSDPTESQGGFMAGMSQSNQDDTINVPYATMDLLWGPAKDVLITLVRTQPGADVNQVADRAEAALTARGSDVSTITYSDISSFIGNITSTLSGFLAGIAAISLLVGGVGVMNTMFTSVLERTKEIGVMKAIGAKNRHVLGVFLIESGLMGLAGGVIGSGLGVGLAYLGILIINQLTEGFEVMLVINPALIVLMLVGSFLLGAISGLWPARRASRLPVVDALRYE
jgi:putative ABC transport system permease protein